MILHLGGVFGDKAATLDRFRENYARLSQNVKDRLVLENDDVSWSVHELLPLCEELNIPMVLDFHHHNIIFDPDQIREGTKDIMDLFPRILATWRRKNITPKMHYSEPTPAAITGRQRRKHNPRVATLPPCPPDMDLMIEAKDKEQAVFELMRTFKLPGFDTFNDIVPHVRKDDNKPIKTPKKKTPKKKKVIKNEEDEADAATEEAEEDPVQETIATDEVGMGGPEGRVYWPPGMEHWLRPVKKVIKPKQPKDETKMTPAQKKKVAAAEAAKEGAKVEEEVHGDDIKEEPAVADTPTPASRKTKAAAKPAQSKAGAKKAINSTRKTAKAVPTPSASDAEDDAEEEISDFEQEPEVKPNKKAKINGNAAPKRQSGRAKKMSYAEEDDVDME